MTYTGDGDVATANDSVNGNWTYAYDDFNRLASSSQGSPATQAFTYGYDRFGNRWTQAVTVGSGPSSNLSFDANNHIADGSTTYDAAGNTWTYNDGVSTHTYTYDAENRITVVDPQLNPVAATSTYLGALRVQKQTSTAITVYVYSGTKPIAEYVGGALSKEYIYGGSGLLATVAGSTVTYEHPDHLSIRVESDAGGNVVRSYGHLPFGETWYENVGKGGSPGKWDFTTYERDSESALDYANFRYDSGRLGRFMSPDPLAGSVANPQSLNRYSYVGNDPVNAVDPLGLVTLGPFYVCYPINSATDGSVIGEECQAYYLTMVAESANPGTGPFDASKGGDGHDGSCDPMDPSCVVGSSQSGGGGGFTLGIRSPHQTWMNCMHQHAQDYSLAGTIDLVRGTNIKGNLVGDFFLGNHVGGALLGSGGEAVITGAHSMPTVASQAMGSTLAFGRYAPNTALDLGKGTGNAATSALGWETNLAAKGVLSGAERVLNLGMSVETRLGIDIGFTLAEGVGCAIKQ